MDSKDRVIGQIYQTNDYTQFSYVDGNRKVTHSKIIGKSIDKHGALLSPIIVNEYGQIIDGQNRFEALMERQLPITYIIAQGYDVEQVRALNEGSKNWSYVDYIESYASLGSVGCSNIVKFLSDFPGIKKSSLLEIVVPRRGYIKEHPSSLFSFNPDMDFSRKVADAIRQLKTVDINEPKIYDSRDLVRALKMILKIEGFSMQVLVDKISLQPRSFVRCANPAQYLDMFEDLYNYRNSKKLHFDF